MDLKIEPIGYIHHDVGGSDQYVLITCHDASQKKIHREILDRFFKTTESPGGYFCHTVLIIPHADKGKFIGVIHHRYDI